MSDRACRSSCARAITRWSTTPARAFRPDSISARPASCRRCTRSASRRLDRLIVSHGDNDHAGGAAAVLAAFPSTPVESGEPERGCRYPPRSASAASPGNGTAWRFRIVHPHEPLSTRSERSLLRARSAHAATASCVLTGDITVGGRRRSCHGDRRGRACTWCCRCRITAARPRPSEAFIAALHPSSALVSSRLSQSLQSSASGSRRLATRQRART